MILGIRNMRGPSDRYSQVLLQMTACLEVDLMTVFANHSTEFSRYGWFQLSITFYSVCFSVFNVICRARLCGSTCCIPNHPAQQHDERNFDPKIKQEKTKEKNEKRIVSEIKHQFACSFSFSSTPSPIYLILPKTSPKMLPEKVPSIIHLLIVSQKNLRTHGTHSVVRARRCRVCDESHYTKATCSSQL